MMRLARATSSFVSPQRSRPNRMPTLPPPVTCAAISLGGGLRPHHRLGLVVGARGRGKQQVEIGNRLLDGRKQLGALEDMVGTGRRALGGDVGPAVARVDDAQAIKREIAHGPRSHADILAELRLDQNDRRAVEIEAGLGSVGARHRFRFKFKALNRPVEMLIQRARYHPRLPAACEFLKLNMGLESALELTAEAWRA